MQGTADLGAEFKGAFAQQASGREIIMCTMRNIMSIDLEGAQLVDSVFAAIALKARRAGISWVAGGVRFIINHEEGHPRYPLDATEKMANVYALVRSDSPAEDYSSSLALGVAALQFRDESPPHSVYGLLKSRMLSESNCRLDEVGRSIEAAQDSSARGTIRDMMEHHGADRYLKGEAFEAIERMAMQKYLALASLLRGRSSGQSR